MFKNLKDKFFKKEDREIEVTTEEVIADEQVEEQEPIQIEEEIIVEEVTSEEENEEIIQLRDTQSIRVEFEEVINRLDQVVGLVENETIEISTIDLLQHESSILIEEEIAADNTQKLIKFEKEMLLDEADDIKKNSDTYLINEGMFELHSQLHNANLIISDTNIPKAISKQDVLEGKTKTNN